MERILKLHGDSYHQQVKAVDYETYRPWVVPEQNRALIDWRGELVVYHNDVKAPVWKLPTKFGDTYYNQNFCMWHHTPHIVFGAEGTIEYEIKGETCKSCGQLVKGHKSSW